MAPLLPDFCWDHKGLRRIKGFFDPLMVFPARPELRCSVVASFSGPMDRQFLAVHCEPKTFQGSQHRSWHNHLSLVAPLLFLVVILFQLTFSFPILSACHARPSVPEASRFPCLSTVLLTTTSAS